MQLWKPLPDRSSYADTLPCLSTGQLDLRKAREVATREANTLP
jgi:hypothetical protein